MPEINAINVGGTTYDIVDKTALHSGSGFKTKQTAVSDPAASGTATEFIKTITQNANGVITATRASLPYTYKPTQSAVSDPSASGTTIQFIKTLSQDTNGVITAAKASLPDSAYITAETNTGTGWTTRTWSDKTVECWRTLSVTSSTTWTAIGATVYYNANAIPKTTFPVTYTAVPQVLITPNPNNDLYACWICCKNAGSTTQTGDYMIMRPASGAPAATYTFDVYVKGTST